MQVRDYTHIIFDEGERFKNLNDLAPQWAFRLLVIGPSGCGKTNLVTDLLLNHVFYTRIYIYAKDPYERFYEFLKDFFELSIENKVLKDYQITDELNEKILLDELEKNKKDQTLVIFDDFINEKESEQKPIKTLFTQGRKKNVSTIYISQTFMDIPKIIRKNSNYLVLFKMEDDGEVKELIRRYSGGNRDKVFEMYKEATKEPHNFFLIDKSTTNPMLKYRKNWSEVVSEYLS